MVKTEQGYVDAGDGQIYYEVAGDGMPLVLTHAAFLDSRMFDEVWDPLARQFRAVRYDMRGFGRSCPASGPLCRRKDLDLLLNHLGIQRAHLVGCSNGGQISLDLALEQRQRVASLTLVNSAPSGFELQGAPPRHMLEMFDAVQRGEVERGSELQIRIWLDGDQREPSQMPHDLRQKALDMNRITVSQNTFLIADMQPAEPLVPPAITRLEAVACPTLIMAGALDHPEVLRAADEMAWRIPGARKIMMEGCGHVPSFEQPDKFTSLLLDFLEGLS